MLKESASYWRPETSCLPRAWASIWSACQAARLRKPTNSWTLETVSFAALSTLMCDLRVTSLDSPKQHALLTFFELAMYYNQHLDRLTYRCRRGRESLVFSEKFWALPQKLTAFKKQCQLANYEPRAIQSATNWFHLNRILNHVSHKLTKKQPIDWDQYQKQSPTKNESRIVEAVQNAFKNWSDRDETEKAILFRAFSSIGFTASLLTLLGNEQLGPLRRIGSMTMAAQMLDDFGSPDKDARYQIMGVTTSTLENPKPKLNGELAIDSQETTLAVGIARQILGACLEEISIDPNHQRAKQFIARSGLILLAGLSTLVMKHKHSGDYYPIKSIAEALCHELISPGYPETQKYRQTTKEAIELALSSLSGVYF